MKTIAELTTEWQFFSKDEFDTCAIYARRAGNDIELQTMYRYDKPVTRLVSKQLFNELLKKNLV